MESSDSDDLIVKLELLNSKRESLCPGFFHWFDHNTRKLFVDSVIQSAKFDGDLKRFYYQNDIESMHSVEKKKNSRWKTSLQHCIIYRTLSKEKKMMKYVQFTNQGNVLSLTYKMFQDASHVSHSWSEERKIDNIKKFREYNPTISDTFTILANSGYKPGFQQRNNTKPDIVIDLTLRTSYTKQKPVS